jgi:hypothetical protein
MVYSSEVPVPQVVRRVVGLSGEQPISATVYRCHEDGLFRLDPDGILRRQSLLVVMMKQVNE